MSDTYRLEGWEQLRVSDRQLGFSLVEAMIALLILSVGLLGAGAMLSTAFQNDRYNNRMRFAQAAAQRKVEEIKSVGAAHYPASGSEETGGMTGTWNVEPDAQTGLNKITVTLSWGRHQVNLVSYAK